MSVSGIIGNRVIFGIHVSKAVANARQLISNTRKHVPQVSIMSSDEFLPLPGSETGRDQSAESASGTPAANPDTVAPAAAAAQIEAEIDTSFDTEVITAPRESDLYKRSLSNALVAAQCADEMRARDIVVLDLTKVASIVDFFVIATGTSRRQMHAVADEVNRKLKWDLENDRLGIEGYRTEANWVLMDFGDVVLHIFTEEGRQLYDLENLKADAERIDWQSLVGKTETE